MSLKQHLICELKELQLRIKAAPGDLKAVMRAGSLVTTLREQWRISDAEMKRILMAPKASAASNRIDAKDAELQSPSHPRRVLRASPRAAS